VRTRSRLRSSPAFSKDFRSIFLTSHVADLGFRVTIIEGISPVAALRRLGAEHVQTATWHELREAAQTKIVTSQAVAAFGASGCAVLVEDGGDKGVEQPELSQGTFAAAAYLSVNADSRMLISRDGVVLVDWDGDETEPDGGEKPDLLRDVLPVMGYDGSEYLNQVEAICRLTGVRPTVDQVTGPILGAVTPI
jgi:hypothetical protein